MSFEGIFYWKVLRKLWLITGQITNTHLNCKLIALYFYAVNEFTSSQNRSNFENRENSSKVTSTEIIY